MVQCCAKDGVCRPSGLGDMVCTVPGMVVRRAVVGWCGWMVEIVFEVCWVATECFDVCVRCV